ncbi:hypothetical protein RRG08_007392 [Elysia crispata]|uniref:Uncharacterized protein n=1 Tax=Elysia crispata TaxID=231223 RepID=A0AAE1E367_9GAST|nr:hypothetical protein RRG08_007392 [Elysia crispata]
MALAFPNAVAKLKKSCNIQRGMVRCREEEGRHQRNLNENEQLKKQIAEWTCSRPCHVSHFHRLRLHATHLK